LQALKIKGKQKPKEVHFFEEKERKEIRRDSIFTV